MSSQHSANLQDLPSEILLQVLAYLTPYEITLFQLVSKQLRSLSLDDKFWRQRCFDESTFRELLLRKRAVRLQPLNGDLDDSVLDGSLHPDYAALHGEDGSHSEQHLVRNLQDEHQRRLDLENWDPVFPGERVSWYDEYIHRNAPIVTNWFQQPKVRSDGFDDIVDVRGVALYSPRGADSQGELLAVSPLDDGSVCIWDVNGLRKRKGAILEKSASQILYTDGKGTKTTRRSKMVDNGVTECISIDNWRGRAFIAVQGRLVEVDLERLETVGHTSFEWSISALSTASPNLPLTVGTSLGIHLHDYRSQTRSATTRDERLDDCSDITSRDDAYDDTYNSIFDDEPLPPYAPLSQPTPLSILHLPQAGSPDVPTDDIYVAGRFSSILHYDRRSFPRIVDSIYSGASLSCLTSLPYPFSTLDNELRRIGALSPEQLRRSKGLPGGRTIVAVGEYNTKGSLELYGLAPRENGTGTERTGGHDPTALEQKSTMKNRQTSAGSKILSVACHGTRLVFSDSSGNLKWFERDGFMEVRRHHLGHCFEKRSVSAGQSAGSSPVASLFTAMAGANDLARKVLSTAVGGVADPERNNQDDVLFWTGEHLGLVSFSSQPGLGPDDFEDAVSRTPEEEALAEEERRYARGMRRALGFQADEVRFVRDLGLGMP